MGLPFWIHQMSPDVTGFGIFFGTFTWSTPTGGGQRKSGMSSILVLAKPQMLFDHPTSTWKDLAKACCGSVMKPCDPGAVLRHGLLGIVLLAQICKNCLSRQKQLLWIWATEAFGVKPHGQPSAARLQFAHFEPQAPDRNNGEVTMTHEWHTAWWSFQLEGLFRHDGRATLCHALRQDHYLQETSGEDGKPWALGIIIFLVMVINLQCDNW